MKPRVLLALGLVLGCMGQGAFAQGFADSVVGQLRGQGYDDVSVEQTLLGRVRIRAEHDDGTREIIVNPRTGEILRDLWIGEAGSLAGVGQLVSEDEDEDGGKGRGRGSDDENDDDNDNDNDNDDDGDGDGDGGGDSDGGGDND